MSTESKAFTIDCACTNCGDAFTRSYAPNTYVENASDGVRVNNTTEFGDTTYIECETCALTRAMSVTDRYPTTDE